MHTSVGTKGWKKHSRNFMREKVRLPSTEGTISFMFDRMNLILGWKETDRQTDRQMDK